MSYTPEPITEENLEAGRRLIEEGWGQVSRAHRMLFRLPPLQSGREAARPFLGDKVDRFGELKCIQAYRGLPESAVPGQYRTLGIPEFNGFRAAGGDTFNMWVHRYNTALVSQRNDNAEALATTIAYLMRERGIPTARVAAGISAEVGDNTFAFTVTATNAVYTKDEVEAAWKAACVPREMYHYHG